MRSAVLIACAAALLAGCAGGGNKNSAALPEQKESPGDLYVQLAEAYFSQGQPSIALQRGLQALEVDKNNPRAHYVLGISYQQLGKTDDARRHFQEALRLEPDNPDFLNANGNILCYQGKATEGLRLLERALDNPLYQSPEKSMVFASFCAKKAGRDAEAERYLRNALTVNPNFSPALLQMAKLHFDRGAYQEARGYMGRYSRVGQPTADALLLAIRIETQLGNKKTADALRQSLRTRFPDAPEVMQL